MVKTAKTSRSAKKRQPARHRSTKSQANKTATRKPRKPATKAAVVLKLLRRDKGATLAELMQATGWQAHSVRGFLSGEVRKRLELPLRSESTDKGRRYWIEQEDKAQS